MSEIVAQIGAMRICSITDKHDAGAMYDEREACARRQFDFELKYDAVAGSRLTRLKSMSVFVLLGLGP